ncbi:Bifunctional F420 biosynthesis protein FbiB [Methanosarcinaceae archaeon Ag5]|uniref:Bifunctional F420 biosynthesis protein FbiB n=1 Tax=Methanolapillus africanus TaxID=3028297 RepID=A0AAE4SFR7_9EURY|nr:Bifunctional F420 biosynthesis protein FbiB [Methanosarcinaceae archaeon Ag5]
MTDSKKIIENETVRTILTRRSVRQYTADSLSDDEILTLMECARFAPSGLNNQPWRYILIQNAETKQQLSGLTHYAEIVKTAPLLIAGFLDISASYHREKDIAALGAGFENILLAAHSMNLGAVWLGEILKNKDQVSEILATPDSYELMAVIAVGRLEKQEAVSGNERTDRKNLDEIIFWEKYSDK